ncbi:manganese catalase family protein [Desulfosporosinus sp. Sb-LF]|uniref:manganese catalase family protein n=1 Tax=Desulfosporosinus sp. Sb-LF TaxID=2560027 RepID=UPI00107FBA16|nr:manganese catalase family protein [Desulfosporosinus sp. Sb-LF]TGE33552.1 Mn-containing catalase [Desulfosporosinus sp. Sb-LF]
MFSYSKPLFYPVHVQHPDPMFGQVLLEHYGGKDSEYSAATQYLNHRSNMSNRHLRDLLGLIAAEEMGHMEMIAIAINKLGGPPLHYVNSQGIPWNISYVDQNLDPMAMLQADVEAEVRARILYNQHFIMTNDPGLKKMISFLGGREDVHKHLFQKAQMLIQSSAPLEQFNELIVSYKMSFQTFTY